jgi:peptide-methionine (R)-S-oxide reductase
MPKQFTDAELKKKLTPEQYHILREKGTEAPFTGHLLHNKDKGDYVCPVCDNVLFSSDTKFDSGSGWPSFYEVASTGAVKLVEDNSGGMRRVEALCSNCGSHLGHVFNDAYDQPTGTRFCINSASLKFMPKGKPKQPQSGA